MLLIKFVPKKKIREAHVVFLFTQVVTWLMGALVVEKGNIKYPIRTFFKKTIKSNFTFEYFIFPAWNVLFNILYPENKNTYIKALYYLLHTSLIIFFEVIALKYTKLIHYKKWKWYWSFITVFIHPFLFN
ncbi:CBO0543 family protein [Robertmurraya beringensis]|uniref:CBO0543 family protein n=1 Tax=Robertmurraya beringensis TaxID=641660 RepID=A0ABV6KRP7_9BACI